MSPSIFLALLQTLSMCCDHDRSDDISTPRYLNDGTVSSCEPFSNRGEMGVVGFLLRDICMSLHLDSLNVMKFDEAQLLMASMSFCNKLKSLLEEIVR